MPTTWCDVEATIIADALGGCLGWARPDVGRILHTNRLGLDRMLGGFGPNLGTGRLRRGEARPLLLGPTSCCLGSAEFGRTMASPMAGAGSGCRLKSHSNLVAQGVKLDCIFFWCLRFRRWLRVDLVTIGKMIPGPARPNLALIRPSAGPQTAKHLVRRRPRLGPTHLSLASNWPTWGGLD